MARKRTPLQEWRRDYANMSLAIRMAKDAARGKWGGYKQPRAQSLAASLKHIAYSMMKTRYIYAGQTAQMWERDRIAREARRNIPNTTSPDNKV